MAPADGTPGAACQKCRVLLDAGYEIVDGQPACEVCAPALKAKLRKRQKESLRLPGGWWTRAALFGGGAALAGAVVYALIVVATAFEPTFLALAIGAVAGIAARAGAGGKGGLPLQFAAVGLTYAAMVAAYLFAGLVADRASALGALAAEWGVVAFAITRPFLSGAVGLVSLVLGFFVAWRFCAEGKSGKLAQDLWQRLADSNRE